MAWYFSGPDSVQWRWVLAAASVPVGIMGLLRSHVPESPRFHLAAGETRKAQQVIENVAEYNQVELPSNWKLVPHAVQQGNDDGYSAIPLSQLQPHPPQSLEATMSSITSTSLREHVSAHSGTPLDQGEEVFQNHGHSFSELLNGALRPTTLRLWLLYFCVQFSSSGMVFALPKLFDQTFPGLSERDIALDLLVGVVGLVPGLAIAYFAVEKSRTISLACYCIAAGAIVAGLGPSFTQKSRVGALLLSILLR